MHLRWSFFALFLLPLSFPYEVNADPLIKQGNGTLTLFANNTSTFTGDTNIEAGTLALSGSGTLSTLGTVTVASGATFDISASSSTQTMGALAGGGTVALGTIGLDTGGSGGSTTFSGNFTGNGTLTKEGSGVFTLSGNNALYTGNTIVNGGTLSLSLNTNLGTGVLTLNGTTLQLTGGTFSSSVLVALTGSAQIDVPSSTATLSGIISGTGSLTKISSGTLVLSGANTYQGGTVVNQGVLSLGSANTLPVGYELTLAGAGAVQLNDHNQQIGALSSTSSSSTISLGSLSTTTLTVGTNNATSSFPGAISGSGKIVKTGTGTFTLLGDNTYTGSTVINQGTLIGNTTSLKGTINNASLTTLIFNQTTNGAFSGHIAGTGLFQKSGGGNLNLSGGTFNQVSVEVQAGTLSVNEGISVGTSLTIDAGATLQGNTPGSITAPFVYNYGTVAPAGNASFGTLTILGSYVQETGSFLRIELSPVSSSDKLIATTVNIEPGATLQVTPDFGTYGPNQLMVIVQATNQLTGRFATIQNDLPTLRFSLTYTSTQVILSLNISPFSSIVTLGNAGKIAHCIDWAFAPTGSDLSFIIDTLRFMTEPQLAQALNQIQPSMLTALALSVENTTLEVQSAVRRRLKHLYGSDRCSEEKTVHIWTDGSASQSHQRGKDSEVGFTTNAYTATLGIDHAFSSRGHLGALFSYARDQLKWMENRGEGEIYNFYQGVYGGWKNHRFYVDASVLTAFNYYGATRVMNLLTVSTDLDLMRKASHTNRGITVDSHLELGLSLGKKLKIRPYLAGDFFFLQQNSFTEKGADSLDLYVRQYKANGLRAEGAVELSECFAIGVGEIMPHLKIGWGVEQRYQGRTLNASLKDQECMFTVKGLNPDRFLFLPAVGVTGKFLEDRLLFSFDYKAALSSKFWDSSAACQFQFNF